MSALDLSTAEKVNYYKSVPSRRKSNQPQRRDMNEDDNECRSEGSNEKCETEIAPSSSATATLLEQRDRMAEFLSMTSRLPIPNSQPNKLSTNDALAFLQAYGKMRSTSMLNAMQVFNPQSDQEKLKSQQKMVQLLPYDTNCNNNSSNGNSRSPSEASEEVHEEAPAHDGLSLMLPHMNSSLAAGTLMHQRLRRYLDDVQPAEAPGIPERTKKQNRWAFNVWREWARKRNMLEDSFVGPFKGVPLDVGQATEKELDYWLSKFVVEIRRKDGNPYPPHTLMQIVMGIQRYLRQQAGKPGICILDRSNPTYVKFRNILDVRIKELTNNGASAMQKSSANMVLLKSDEKINVAGTNNELFQVASEDGMWQAGIIGKDSAQALLNAVFFFNHQTFGIHYVDDHWNLRAENFHFGKGDDNLTPQFIEFIPSSTSMMVATATANGSKVAPRRIYAQKDNPRCIVSLYQKYLTLVPSLGPFYRHPVEPTIVDRSVKFSEQWVGKNRLRAMLKHLIETYKHTVVSQNTNSKKITHGMRILSPHLSQNLIQLPQQNAEDLLPPSSTEKLGIIRPMSVLRSPEPDDSSNEPPLKKQRADTPLSSNSSTKLDDGKKTLSPIVSYDNTEKCETKSSTLELAVPDSIRSVTIQRGSRKITIQLD